jgi:hypothetical protein
MKKIIILRIAPVLLCGLSMNIGPGNHAAARGMRAYLGSPYTAWVRALGPRMRNTSTTMAGWRACPNGKTAQIMVYFENGRALQVSGQSCRGALSRAQRTSLWRLYVPSDARAHGVVHTTLDGDKPAYVSATLARLLPKDVFADCNDHPVQQGLFFVDRHAGWEAVTAGACE